MACATLKRSLDWESLNQRPVKRRRCNPFGQASAGASPSQSTVCATAVHDEMPLSQMSSRSGNFLKKSQCSPFMEASANISKMSPDKINENIRGEIKRLQRCKQLQFSSMAIERMQDSESSGSEMGPDSPRRPDTPPSAIRNPEKALFTFKQVQMICERMLKERADEIRKEYDDVLTTKLAEQYDAFVKFTYDQIQKRYEAVPSYLS